jgi:hypothetical protein
MLHTECLEILPADNIRHRCLENVQALVLDLGV